MLNIVLLMMLLFGNPNIGKQEMLLNAYKDYMTTINNINKPIPDLPNYYWIEINPITKVFFEVVNYDPLKMEIIGSIYLLSIGIVEILLPDPINNIFSIITSLSHLGCCTTWSSAFYQAQPPIMRVTIIYKEF